MQPPNPPAPTPNAAATAPHAAATAPNGEVAAQHGAATAQCGAGAAQDGVGAVQRGGVVGRHGAGGAWHGGEGGGGVGWQVGVGVGAQLVLLALLGAGVGLGPVGWLVGTLHAAAIWAILTTALRRQRPPSLGPADRVTLARAVLAGGVTALVVDRTGQGASVAILVALAAVALVLDGVDGQVARRTGTASPLGARFDTEVDAYLIVVLSIHVATSVGAWVLAIGAMRYVFVVAAWVAPWLRSDLPPSYARKSVAVVQGVVLVVASAGVIARPVTTASVGLALALLMWSFGRDIAWLWRNKARTSRNEPNHGAMRTERRRPVPDERLRAGLEDDDGARSTRLLAPIPWRGRDPLRRPARTRSR